MTSTYWPGDSEIREALRTEQVFRRFKKARLRMLLETIEDVYRRGPINRRFHGADTRSSTSFHRNGPTTGRSTTQKPRRSAPSMSIDSGT